MISMLPNRMICPVCLSISLPVCLPFKLHQGRWSYDLGCNLYAKNSLSEFLPSGHSVSQSSSHCNRITFHQCHDLYTALDLHRIMSGFHGAFATGVASQQGTLTLPDTWFRPQIWDLLVLQLLRPDSSNLPCLYSTFHLEYPLVLSRFCILHMCFLYDKTFLLVH